MSAETTKTNAVSISVSHRFAIQWTLKGAELKGLSGGDASSIRSDLYKFKTSKHLHFYLEIKQSLKGYHVAIFGSKKWSLDFAYAFFVTKDRAFKPQSPDHPSFLTLIQPSYLSDDENVTIHCSINAWPVHQEDENVEEYEISLKEGQTIVDFESMFNLTLPSKHGCQEVKDFIIKGDIPDLSVDKAIDIIRSAHNDGCDALKFLCSEYLMQNITAKHLSDTMYVAIHNCLPSLERACSQKIAFRHFKIS